MNRVLAHVLAHLRASGQAGQVVGKRVARTPSDLHEQLAQRWASVWAGTSLPVCPHPRGVRQADVGNRAHGLTKSDGAPARRHPSGGPTFTRRSAAHPARRVESRRARTAIYPRALGRLVERVLPSARPIVPTNRPITVQQKGIPA